MLPENSSFFESSALCFFFLFSISLAGCKMMHVGDREPRISEAEMESGGQIDEDALGVGS